MKIVLAILVFTVLAYAQCSDREISLSANVDIDGSTSVFAISLLDALRGFDEVGSTSIDAVAEGTLNLCVDEGVYLIKVDQISGTGQVLNTTVFINSQKFKVFSGIGSRVLRLFGPEHPIEQKCDRETTAELQVTIVPDNSPEQVYWDLIEVSVISAIVVNSNSSQNATVCLEEGEYVFQIYDIAGDGLCCSNGNGSYEILLNGEAITSGYQFGALEFKFFDAEPVIGAPTTLPLCSGDETSFEINLTPDNQLEETSFEIIDLSTNVVLYSMYGKPFGQTCLKAGMYALVAYDTAGNGICCSDGNGSYAFSQEGTVIYTSDGQFGLFDRFNFNVASAPSAAPTQTPSTSPTASPSFSDLNCLSSQCLFQYELMPDNAGPETSWQLVRFGSSQGVIDGAVLDLGSYQTCLDPGAYMFWISDAGSNGLCCKFGEGYYRLSLDGTLLKEGGDFKASEFRVFSCSASTTLDTKQSQCSGSNHVEILFDGGSTEDVALLTRNLITQSKEFGYGVGSISFCLEDGMYLLEPKTHPHRSIDVLVNAVKVKTVLDVTHETIIELSL